MCDTPGWFGRCGASPGYGAGMGDRGNVEIESRPQAYGLGAPAPEDLQARLARAYLSGNGAEVERLLALVAEANYTLPPKTARAA